MKIVRTVTQEVVSEGPVSATPKWKVGDRLKVYSGPNEDHRVTVKDVRWRTEYSFGSQPHFEYLAGTLFTEGWYDEGNLVETSSTLRPSALKAYEHPVRDNPYSPYSSLGEHIG